MMGIFMGGLPHFTLSFSSFRIDSFVEKVTTIMRFLYSIVSVFAIPALPRIPCICFDFLFFFWLGLMVAKLLNQVLRTQIEVISLRRFRSCDRLCLSKCTIYGVLSLLLVLLFQVLYPLGKKPIKYTLHPHVYQKDIRSCSTGFKAFLSSTAFHALHFIQSHVTKSHCTSDPWPMLDHEGCNQPSVFFNSNIFHDDPQNSLIFWD